LCSENEIEFENQNPILEKQFKNAKNTLWKKQFQKINKSENVFWKRIPEFRKVFQKSKSRNVFQKYFWFSLPTFI